MGQKVSTRTLLLSLVLLGLVATGASQSRSTDALMALGRHLAQECTSCHSTDGVGNGIPPIIGLEPEYFVKTLNLYQRGERTNPAMVSVAQSLDEEQIRALSIYLGSLGKPDAAEASCASSPEKPDC